MPARGTGWAARQENTSPAALFKSLISTSSSSLHSPFSHSSGMVQSCFSQGLSRAPSSPQTLTFQGVNVSAPRVFGVFLQVLLSPGGLREELVFNEFSGEKEGEVTARKVRKKTKWEILMHNLPFNEPESMEKLPQEQLSSHPFPLESKHSQQGEL